MTFFALALVLAAAVFHATWNLLAKRVGDGGAVFVWLFGLCSLVIYAPLAVVVVLGHDADAVRACLTQGAAQPGHVHPQGMRRPLRSTVTPQVGGQAFESGAERAICSNGTRRTRSGMAAAS
jgi:hypothetical protein